MVSKKIAHRIFLTGMLFSGGMYFVNGQGEKIIGLFSPLHIVAPLKGNRLDLGNKNLQKLLAAEKHINITNADQILLHQYVNEINSYKNKNLLNTNMLDQIDKKRIPYVVPEEEIKDIVKSKIPSSTENAYYWTDIHKDNDQGTIKVSIYGRVFYLLKGMRHINYDVLLEQHTITGFEKYPTREIIRERTFRVFHNEDHWLKGLFKGYNSNYWKNTQWYQGVGTSFVFKKDENKPKYYFFTNKHLTASYPLITIGKNAQGQKVKQHIVDYVANDPKKHYGQDLRGLMTVGRGMNQESKRRVFSNNQSILKESQTTLLEKYDSTKNIVKEINLVFDFSNPHTYMHERERNTQDRLQNHDNIHYSKLADADQTKEKVTADAMIFSVEFINEASDPFKSWWTARPTQHRNFRIEDARWRKMENIQHDGLYAAGFETEIWNGEYCKEIPKSYEDMSVSKGTHDLSIFSPFFHTKKQSYSQYSLDGQIKWEDIQSKLIYGASGGPVFDKNLQIMGVFWGGTMLEEEDKNGTSPNCTSDIKKHPGYFTWLGIDKSAADKLNNIFLKNINPALRHMAEKLTPYNYWELPFK